MYVTDNARKLFGPLAEPVPLTSAADASAPCHAARCRAFDGVTLPRAGLAPTSFRPATVWASFRTGRAGRFSSDRVASEDMYRTARFVVGYSHDPTIGPDVR